jgi:hypothetical protein
MMSSPWVDSKCLSVAGATRKRCAGCSKEPLYFLASIGVSVVAALEQAKRVREKYNYGETVSRKKLDYAMNEFSA